MTATIGNATSGSRPELINATYQRFRRMGFDDSEAANLTALKNGFGRTSQPWTVREVSHLLFLRESRHVCRRWSDADDRVDSTDWTRVPRIVDRAPTPAASHEMRAPAAQSTQRDGSDPSGGAVTLLTLFRSMAGPDARLDHLRRPGPPRLDARGGPDGEGG
jgi:hypothetical protein